MSGAARTVGLLVKWAFLLRTAILGILIFISSERLIGFSNATVVRNPLDCVLNVAINSFIQAACTFVRAASTYQKAACLDENQAGREILKRIYK